VRATIQKTEVRGPKTSPFVVYMLHVRTAFTVRGLPRRYSDFVMLDSKLRAHFVNGCRPPPSCALLLVVMLRVLLLLVVTGARVLLLRGKSRARGGGSE